MSVQLARIDLFPIKSFDALTVPAARVLPSGALDYDRRYALFDAAGQVINGKRTPLVHRLEATFTDPPKSVTLRDRQGGPAETFSLIDDRRQLERWLTVHFGQPVSIREETSAGFPDDTLAPGPTVIATETLAAVADWFNISAEDARQRFRANLILKGSGPFWEDRLFGPPGDTVTLRIGELLLFGTNPCARCVVPTRDPHSGQQMPGFARTFTAHRRETLPAWSAADAFDHYFRLAVNTRLFAPSAGGIVRVGDAVEVLDGA